MEKKSKKSIVIGITSLFLVTLILLGLTYAYYRTRIIGNENTSISVTSEKLELIYGDGNGTINITDNVVPGYTSENTPKTFTVKNTGSQTLSYNIVFDNVNNGFVREGGEEDWSYEIYSGESILADRSNLLTTGYITRTTRQILLANESIESKATNNYVIIIKYANSDEDQSEDMGASLSLRVNIEESNRLSQSAPNTLAYAIANENAVVNPLSNPGENIVLDASKEVVGIGDVFQYQDAYYAYYEDGTVDTDFYVVYASSYKWTEAGFSLVDPSVAKFSEIEDIIEGKYITEVDIHSSGSLTDYTNVPIIYQVDGISVNLSETPEFFPHFKYMLVKPLTIVGNYESELSLAKDVYGTSYYFRGAVENNYVNFNDMCWRIVRVQGNDTIKIILEDKDHLCDDVYYTKSNSGILDNNIQYFPDGNDGLSVEHYKYENSRIKPILDSWVENIDNTKIVQDNKWCNDTSYYRKDEEVYFGFYRRRENPSLECNFTGDEGSTSTIIEAPVGLITADELLFAGLPDGGTIDFEKIGESAFIRGDDYYHVMTPYWFAPGWGPEVVFSSSYVSSLNNVSANIRPTIVLKKDITISSGNGTIDKPYVIS